LSPESEFTTSASKKQLGSRVKGIALSHLHGTGLVFGLG
jgi:hypothetical protein